MNKILLNYLPQEFHRVLSEVLVLNKGNEVKAAAELGIARGSLRKYIKHFHINTARLKKLTKEKSTRELEEVLENL